MKNHVCLPQTTGMSWFMTTKSFMTSWLELVLGARLWITFLVPHRTSPVDSSLFALDIVEDKVKKFHDM